MNKKDELIILKALLKTAIDGGSADAYSVLVYQIEQMPAGAKNLKFSLGSIHRALKANSKIWQKEINKVINN